LKKSEFGKIESSKRNQEKYSLAEKDKQSSENTSLKHKSIGTNDNDYD